MDTLVGKTLSHYRIVAEIGAGGVGVVYRARDEVLRRDVAVKVLPAAVSDQPDRIQRFEQEARAAGALNHPNILAIYDFGEHDGCPYVPEGESGRASGACDRRVAGRGARGACL